MGGPKLLRQLIRAGIVAALCLSANTLVAAPLSLQIDRKEIAINEAFEVTLQVNARHAVVKILDTEDFTVQDATSAFNQPLFCMNMGMEVISGPCIYRFYFKPARAGKLTIPSIQLIDNFARMGRLIAKTEETPVTVSPERAKNPKTGPKSRARSRRPGSRRRDTRQAGGPAVAAADQKSMRPSQLAELEDFARYDIFLIPQTGKDTYYLNEPFSVDFVLYIGEKSGANSLQELELPELDGFRKERLEGKNAELGGTTVRGKRYSRFLLSSFVLVPMEAGDKVVDSARATVLVSVSNMQQINGGFSISIRGGSQPLEVFAPPLQLDIRATPEPLPPSFDTANIGSFKIEKMEPPKPQPAGSWMVLKYDLVGRGNLLSVEVPTLAKSPGIEARRPHLDNSNVTIDERGINGRLAVQLPFRVTHPGKMDLPPLEFTYFDPDQKEYETISVPLPAVVVDAPRTVEGEVLLPTTSDLAPLATEADFTLPEEFDGWARGGWVAWAMAMVLGFYVLLLLLRAVLSLADRDPVRRRRKAALISGRKELAASKEHLVAGRTDAFYAALTRALAGYLEGRFGLSTASSTFDALEEGLTSQGVSSELARLVRQELENADFSRFAPTQLQEQDTSTSLERTRSLIARLNRVKGRLP
jgi:hypothetical protein